MPGAFTSENFSDVNHCQTKAPRRACQSFCAVLFYACYVDLPDLGMRGRGRSFYTGAAIYPKPAVQSNIISRYVVLERLT